MNVTLTSRHHILLLFAIVTEGIIIIVYCHVLASLSSQKEYHYLMPPDSYARLQGALLSHQHRHYYTITYYCSQYAFISGTRYVLLLFISYTTTYLYYL